MAGTPRRRAPDERREQLLDAAESVLVERGLSAATVSDVASAAGVAKGTLYLYFDSKDALLAGLRARYLERFGNALGASVTGTGAAAVKRLKQFVSGLFEFSVENQELHHLLFHQAGFSEEDAFAGARSILEGIVQDGVTDGTFRVKDVASATGFVLNGLHGVLLDAMHAQDGDLRAAVGDAQALSLDVLTRSSRSRQR